jgi:hypothetical protein
MKTIPSNEEDISPDTCIQKQPTTHGKTYNQASDDWNSHYHMIDNILEKEKQFNKTESWTKLDKIHKIQKLNEFAEKYGNSMHLTENDINSLKSFLTECIKKSKLQKTKEVEYDKINHEIKSIPALQFNTTTLHYSLKILDKRISTTKSLAPKNI